jgi:hypothetical protein
MAGSEQVQFNTNKQLDYIVNIHDFNPVQCSVRIKYEQCYFNRCYVKLDCGFRSTELQYSIQSCGSYIMDEHNIYIELEDAHIVDSNHKL